MGANQETYINTHSGVLALGPTAALVSAGGLTLSGHGHRGRDGSQPTRDGCWVATRGKVLISI